MTLDPALGTVRGDVLVRDGLIQQVGQVERTLAGNAEIIDAREMVVLPGFVDTHRHTWQSCIRHRNGDHHGADYFRELLDVIGPSFSPYDVYIGTLLGAIGAIAAGTTTLFDWAHIQNSPAHADAGIRALRESGIRAVFGHGRSLADPHRRMDQRGAKHSRDIRRLQQEHFATGRLLTLAMAARGPEATTDEVWRADLEMARELGIRSSMHVGIAGLGPVHRAVQRIHDAGEMGADLIFIHANRCSDDELAHIAESGAGVSLGLQVEMTSQGSGAIPTDRLLAAGVWPSLSGDTETLGSGDMLTQMRMALAEYRLKAGTGQAAEGAPSTLSTEDVLRMATEIGARTLRLGEATGTLTPGKAADIVLIDGTDINLAPLTDPVGAVVLAAHPGNVDTVLVGGRILKRAKQLVGVDLERLLALARAPNHRHPSPPT